MAGLADRRLAVAAAESAFAGDLGAELSLSTLELKDPSDAYDADATLLFSESCTRWIVEVAPKNEDDFRACFEHLPLAHIGRVTDSPRLQIRASDSTTTGAPLIDLSTDALRAAHQSGFQG